MRYIYKCWPIVVVAPLLLLVLSAATSPARPLPDVKQDAKSTVPATHSAGDESLADVVLQVDQYFENRWQQEQLTPVEKADELSILRRLSLALHGTIPSLEEIRIYEADASPDRLDQWVRRLMDDPRFADYFAERMARCFVGTETGPFVFYRRDRFVAWLGDQLSQNRPYDEIVRAIISERGLWTSSPATNFVTVAIENDNLNEEKLAARTVRAFLGQRIDCAQCHDHPFAEWKQHQFEGLAAFYAQSKLSASGLIDDPEMKFVVQDRVTLEDKTIPAAVPFSPEWYNENSGTPREQLAAWVTHQDNKRFERATVNRIWGLMFGRPFIAPVDDLPDPNPKNLDVLDIIGTDFRQHGYDLKRLIRVIARSRPFQHSSESSAADSSSLYQLSSDWAIFPLTRLRPEQMIGSIFQSAFLKTVDRESHWAIRGIRLVNENDFTQEYGDLGDQELEEHSSTIPQALIRMNGELPNKLSEANLLTAAGRIARLSPDPEKCLEACFLVGLTRRPTADERTHFLAQFKSPDNNDDWSSAVEDIYWAIFNSPEFSWNH